ncbi:MAG TPA: hypothetical protein VLX09_04740 [Stellaceae bacterium]|nr:hypothetical protein [Stellaceae bacterium]
MKEAHRRVHRRLWPALALAVGIAFALALILRPPIPIEPPAAGAQK